MNAARGAFGPRLWQRRGGTAEGDPRQEARQPLKRAETAPPHISTVRSLGTRQSAASRDGASLSARGSPLFPTLKTRWHFHYPLASRGWITSAHLVNDNI
jgi:hypothetical protein